MRGEVGTSPSGAGLDDYGGDIVGTHAGPQRGNGQGSDLNRGEPPYKAAMLGDTPPAMDQIAAAQQQHRYRLAEELRLAKEELRSLQERSAQNPRLFGSLRTAGRSVEERAAELRERVAEAQRALDERAERYRAELAEERKELKRYREKLRNKAEQLAETARRQRESLAQQKEQLERRASELQALRAENLESERLIHQQREELNRRGTELQALRLELETARESQALDFQSRADEVGGETSEPLASGLNPRAAERIAELEELAAARQRELDEKESALRQREEELQQLRRELADADEAQADQFSRSASMLDDQLVSDRAESDAEAAAQHRRQELLLEQEAALAERESTLRAQEAQLAELAAAHQARESHIRDLQQQLDASKSELSARRDELETAQERAEQQERAHADQLALLEERRNELDARHAELQRRQQALAEQEDALASRTEELARREAAVAGGLADLRQRQDELDRQLLRADETADQAAELERRAAELSRSETELDRRVAESAASESRLAEQTEALEQSGLDLAAESAAIEARQSDLARREQTLGEQESEIEARIVRAIELERRVRERETDLTAEEEKVSAAREAIRIETESLDRRREEIARDRAEIDRLRAELRQRRDSTDAGDDGQWEERAAIERAREEIEAERGELHSARERIARQQAELSQLAREHEESRVVLAADRARLEGDQVALRDKERSIEQQRADLEAARIELEEARLKLARRVAETKEMSHKLAEKARRLAHRKDQLIEEGNALEARKCTLDAKAERIAAQREELDAQRSELQEERTRFEAERQRLEAAGQEHNRARQELDRSLKQLHAERQDLEEGRARVAEAESAVEAERLRLDEARQTMQAQRRELLEIQERHGVSSERLAALITQAEQHEQHLHEREQALVSREEAVAGRAAEIASADADIRERAETLDRKAAGVEADLANLERRRGELEALVAEHEAHLQRLREEAEADIAAERESLRRREAELESLIESRRKSLERESEQKQAAEFDDLRQNVERHLADRRAELHRHETEVQERLEARRRQVETDVQARLHELESELARRRAEEEHELRTRREALEAQWSQTRAELDEQLEDLRRRQLALSQEERLLRHQRIDVETEEPGRPIEVYGDPQEAAERAAQASEHLAAPGRGPRSRFRRRAPLAACAVLCGALASAAIMYAPNAAPSVRGRVVLGDGAQAPPAERLASLLATTGLFARASESIGEDLSARFQDGTIRFSPEVVRDPSSGADAPSADAVAGAPAAILLSATDPDIAPDTLQSWLDALGGAYVGIVKEARLAALSADGSRQQDREEIELALSRKRTQLADVQAEIDAIKTAMKDDSPGAEGAAPGDSPANQSLEELKAQLARAAADGDAAADALDRHRRSPHSAELPIPTPQEIAEALAGNRDAIETLHQIDAKAREFHNVLTAAVAETQTPLIDLLSETDAFIEEAESLLLPSDDAAQRETNAAPRAESSAPKANALSSIDLPAELRQELEQVRLLLLDLQESAHAFATDWDQLVPKLASWTPAESTVRRAAEPDAPQPPPAAPASAAMDSAKTQVPNYLEIVTQGELLLEYQAAAEKLIYQFYESSKSKLALAIDRADQIARHGEPLPTRRIIRAQLTKAGHKAFAARNDWILAAQDLIRANNLQLKSLGDELGNLLQRFDPRDARRGGAAGPQSDDASTAFLPVARREAAALHADRRQQEYEETLTRLQSECDAAEQRRDHLNQVLIKALDRERSRQSQRASRNESLRESQTALANLEQDAAALGAEIAELAKSLGGNGADASLSGAGPSEPHYEPLPPLRPSTLDRSRLSVAVPSGAAVAVAFVLAAAFLGPSRRRPARDPAQGTPTQ